jgi:hypothetical protein
MTGLGIESDGDNVALSGDINRHLPCLLTDRLSPIDFAGEVVFGNLRYEVLETIPPADFFDWRENDDAVSHRNVHLVTNSKLSIL